jgi:glycosyltransferase involved in cell wall biosynthesis
MKNKITFFVRKPFKTGNYSVETYCKILEKNLSKKFDIKIYKLPFHSKGLFRRIFNCIACVFNQGDVNHIIGDIHYVTLFLNQKKTILTILDCVALHNNTGLRKNILKYLWFTLPIKKSALVTTISKSTLNDLKDNLQIDFDASVINFFIDNSSFSYKPLSMYNKKLYNLLQIGTAPNKNIDRLIEALIGTNCKITFIGSLTLKQKEFLKKNKINYNIIAGGISDTQVQEQYTKSDIVTYVSTLEGFGMPILEANKIGRPILTSNLSSMPEIGGDSALYVNPYSVADIKKGIKRLCNDISLRKRLIQSGINNYKRFNSKIISNQYANLYNNLLKHG